LAGVNQLFSAIRSNWGIARKATAAAQAGDVLRQNDVSSRIMCGFLNTHGAKAPHPREHSYCNLPSTAMVATTCDHLFAFYNNRRVRFRRHSTSPFATQSRDKTAGVKASLTLKFVEKAGLRRSDKMAHCQLEFTLARNFMSI